MNSLKDQVAVVTGASSGIGKSIALALAKQGAILCLLGRNLNSLNEVAHISKQSTDRVNCYKVDLSDDREIADFQKSVSAEFSAVNILVHSAGVFSMGPLESLPVEDFDLQFKINVRGPYLLTQLLLPLLKLGRGQVIFINSRAVFLNARPGLGQYTATKQALKALTDSFRQEVNPEGIRVVSIYPGRTSSPMQQDVFKAEGKKYEAELLIQPADIAATIVDLLCLPITAEVTDITIRPMIEPP